MIQDTDPLLKSPASNLDHSIPLRDNPLQYQLVKTRLQQQDANGRTQCGLCLWRCKLQHGQRGFCQAHVNRNGTLYNLTYGIVSAMDIGTIESKPVKHYRPGTRILSIGSYGCNFRCGGCHNLKLSWGLEALDALAQGQSNDAFLTPQQVIDAAIKAGVQGIAFTYSEPAIWLEYVLDVAQRAHEAGLYTVYVSNSFATEEALLEIAPHIDVLCSDIKSFSDAFYSDICKKASVAQILKCVETAHRLHIHVETRTNIIPGKNDDVQTLTAIARWIHRHLGENSPWHITKFFPAYHLSHLPPTPSHMLQLAYRIGIEAGLKRVYVYDDKGCDCAAENQPISAYLSAPLSQSVKKCAADCCGEEGILLKKYETGL